MDEEFFSNIIQTLDNAGVIVYPTDTLYGLGADVFNDTAVEKVFKIKKRPWDKPLSVAVSNIDEMEKIADIDDKTEMLVECFLPGKLTLVLYKKSDVSDIVTGGSEKIAVRIPDQKIALRILEAYGPLTATSANIHGEKTPHIINDIQLQFKDEDIAVYIDYGRLDGKPSTIVDMTKEIPEIVRQGEISKEDIMDAINNE